MITDPSTVVRMHQVELRPQPHQEEYFRKCSGTYRYMYNLLVARARGGLKYDRRECQQYCVRIRQDTPWMQEVSCRATYEAAENFHRAMSAFFRSASGKRRGPKVGFPKFKKRGERDSFQLTHGGQFSIRGRRMRVQGLESWISMREKPRFDGVVKAVAIHNRAGKWYATLTIRYERPRVTDESKSGSLGVDLGLKAFAVISDGDVVENPKFDRRMTRLLSKRHRQLSRKEMGSNRYLMAKERFSVMHKKVADQRKAFHHDFANKVVRKSPARVVMEDLNVSGIAKSPSLARSVYDAGWGAARAIVKYKCSDAGIQFVTADQWYPSSKKCSCCGNRKESLSLSDRRYNCQVCGVSIDRDLNAAINLAQYSPALPNKESRKTCAVATCKTIGNDGCGDDESLDGANNLTSNRGTTGELAVTAGI